MNMDKFEKVVEKGYDLNIIALLYMCRAGENIFSSNEKIRAFTGLMERKGLILEGKVTAAGDELLSYVEDKNEVKKEKEKVADVESIYHKVIERIEKYTGKKQVRTDIYGKKYNYVPVLYDFTFRLKKVINKYKLTDIDKVEKVILANIDSCHKTGKWYPLLLYYFSKTKEGQEVSTLAEDYENWKEGDIEKPKTSETII